jgi:hypothetical protein
MWKATVDPLVLGPKGIETTIEDFPLLDGIFGNRERGKDFGNAAIGFGDRESRGKLLLELLQGIDVTREDGEVVGRHNAHET